MTLIMLNALRNWIWSSEKKSKNSEEVIVPVLRSQNISGTISDKSPVVINKHTRKYEYIT